MRPPLHRKRPHSPRPQATSTEAVVESLPHPEPQTEPQNTTEEGPDSNGRWKNKDGDQYIPWQGPKLKSEVWSHAKKYKKILAGTNKECAVGICNYCGAERNADSREAGTTPMKNHLNDCKLGPYYRKEAPNDPTQPAVMFDRETGEVKGHVFNQKRHEMMIYRWIIMDEMPFRAVEGQGFVEMMADICPRLIIPNRRKTAEGVFDIYLQFKGAMMSVLHGSRVSITTDTWTSIQNINYMVTTAHFVDDGWKLHKRIISFTKIISHKGEDIGELLEKILNEWGIVKVFSITVDNATANDGAVDFIEDWLSDKGFLLADGKYLHMRCNCHIINLIVKDGLKELNPAIEAIRNCVKYIHSSPSRLNTFRDYCQRFNLGEMANIPMDVTTRWNSTYKMLDGALKFRHVFKKIAEENILFNNYFAERTLVKKGKDREELVKRVGPPIDSDWDKAYGFVHFLHKFYEVTLKLSATKTVTSHLIFVEMLGLQNAIERKMCDARDLVLQKAAKDMKPKFDKYFGSFEKVNKLMFVAHVLDPRYKMQKIEIAFRKLGYSEEKVRSICVMVRNCLLDLYNEYKPPAVAPTASLPMEIVQDDSDDDEIEREVMRQRKEQEHRVVTHEVEVYLTDSYVGMIEGWSLLEFWSGSKSRYPVLYKIAKDVLAVPSSTVASESAFSLGKRIVDPFRCSLTPKMVEALVCTSDWLRAAPLDFYKDPTDDELTFYKECEAFEKKLEQPPNDPPLTAA